LEAAVLKQTRKRVSPRERSELEVEEAHESVVAACGVCVCECEPMHWNWEPSPKRVRRPQNGAAPVTKNLPKVVMKRIAFLCSRTILTARLSVTWAWARTRETSSRADVYGLSRASAARAAGL
jgi:hypothetical protein